MLGKITNCKPKKQDVLVIYVPSLEQGAGVEGQGDKA
jgi:hypothetical protein